MVATATSTVTDVDIVEDRQLDSDEQDSVCSFVTATCGCNKGSKSRQCSQKFTADYILSVRASCAELAGHELDMAIMGQLLACMNTQPVIGPSHRHSLKDRQKYFTSYFHHGQPICEKMFCFLHGIGRTRFKNLKKSVQTNGLVSRSHSNTKYTPYNATSLSSMEFLVWFLLNYAEQNGILLPGRVPGYSRSDIKLLPSSVLKRTVWRVYEAATQEDNMIRAVAYSSFCRLWRSLLPSVIIMKPMTDLCWQCQKNSSAILRSANLTRVRKVGHSSCC